MTILYSGTPETIIEQVAKQYQDVWETIGRLRCRIHPYKRSIAEHEMAVLYAMAKDRGRILEIGTALGHSASILAMAAPGSLIRTLNPKNGEFEQAAENLLRYSNVSCVKKTSLEYLEVYDGLPYDFIFVDGDHGNVSLDLPYWNLLDEGGLMLFHDYSPEGSGRECPPVYHVLNEVASHLGRPFDVTCVDDTNVGMVGYIKREGETMPDLSHSRWVVTEDKVWELADVGI